MVAAGGVEPQSFDKVLMRHPTGTARQLLQYMVANQGVEPCTLGM